MQGAKLAGMALPGVGEIMAVVAAVSALSGAVAYFYEPSDMKAVRDMTTEARGLDRTMRDLHSAYEDTAMDNLATAETARMFNDRLRLSGVWEAAAGSRRGSAPVYCSPRADLATMVQNYQELQDAQAKTSESIGALAADFDQQTDEMAQYVADMVQDMDLSAEAKQAAIQTLNGYIAGLNSQSGPMAAAFGQIYGAAKSGIFRNGYGGRPATGKGYASGTDYATPGIHLVGEEGPEIVAMRGGEQVIPTRESVKLLSSREAPSINAPIEIRIEGNATPETVSQIRLAADELREAVINIILEEQQDERRRSYS